MTGSLSASAPTNLNPRHGRLDIGRRLSLNTNSQARSPLRDDKASLRPSISSDSVPKRGQLGALGRQGETLPSSLHPHLQIPVPLLRLRDLTETKTARGSAQSQSNRMDTSLKTAIGNLPRSATATLA